MNLKQDYKNDMPPQTGRAWRITENGDGTVKLADETQYLQKGDAFGADDVNAITSSINKLSVHAPQICSQHEATDYFFTLPEGFTTNNCAVVAAFQQRTGGYFQAPFYSSSTPKENVVWVSGIESENPSKFDFIFVQRYK